MSIPKIIHYCWFGRNSKPELALKCIQSWKKYCPDYLIKECNEDNFDIHSAPLYVQKAYEHKKWAFVTDYVRLKVVYDYGGIYLDTDVELLRPFDALIKNRAFMGCEGTDWVNTGLGFGAEAGFPVLYKNMTIYENIVPIDEHGAFSSSPSPYYTTNMLKEMGVVFPIDQITELSSGLVLYPNKYFNPYDWKNKKLSISPCTYSIHHYSGSWMTNTQKLSFYEQNTRCKIERLFGEKAGKLYSFMFWNQKKHGGSGLLNSICKRIMR